MEQSYQMKECVKDKNDAWGDQTVLFECLYKPIFLEQAYQDILDIPLDPTNPIVVNLNFMKNVIKNNVSS